MPAPDAAADERLRQGDYARKQLFGACSVLRWSHGSRFRMAAELVRPHAGRALLDYGCGDGTFLAMVQGDFPRALGVEADPGLADACAARFAPVPGVEFVHTSALESIPGGSFGVAVCMEVLEHCTPEQVDEVLAALRSLLAPDGTLVVSVPVETGAPLVAKQLVRALAGRRGIPGYQDRERYRPAELWRMVFAGPRTAIERPVYEGEFAPGVPNRWHGHKGFNWRALRSRVARTFTVRETRFSPLGGLGGQLASQAWLVCGQQS